MDLLLNDVLHLTREEIENSKIEFNMQAGSGGQPFLDRWLKHTEEEKNIGTCKDSQTSHIKMCLCTLKIQ